ncbi:hypothetical protein DMUE_5137 [Dictyocoela muelleri]|nr:hypothetical protein DMUE_5137 [Dictyocoela muelleri]
MKFSRKRLSLIPVKRNTPQLIGIRKIYACFVNQIHNEQLIFLDKSGFNAHTQRHYGYTPLGEKAIKVVRGNRGSNISLLSMITLRGTLAYEIKQGAINTNILADFLDRYLEESVEESPQPILIIDNTRFHHSQRVREICNEKGVIIKYLPDYSPQLNPIEDYFSIVKARFQTSSSPRITLAQINECIVDAIVGIELQIYVNLFNNMRSWIDKATAGGLFI